MANPYINRVDIQRGGTTETLINLTGDTITAADLAQGVTAHDASGASITGTYDKASGSVYQDGDGYLVVDDNESSAPQGNLSITANGTYDVSDYAGASVDIPVGMTETDLKNYIQRSSGFTDIDWPDGLTSIGSHAFADCTYFNPSSIPDGIRRINSYAFYKCSRLALTSLPSSIISISSYAFQGCSALALTSLPDGMETIESYTFESCAALALTSLPSGVTVVNSYAFQGCANITLSVLPDSLTEIYVCAFRNCTGILSISSEAAITSLGNLSFCGDSTHTMQLKSVSFPNMALTSNIITVFGSNTAAYACKFLEFCDIGSTVGINGNAFANCYALQTLVLRRSDAICALSNVNAFTNTPMSGYNNLTGTVYVPQALISTYQTATNWSTLYNAGTVTFAAIEGSEYER